MLAEFLGVVDGDGPVLVVPEGESESGETIIVKSSQAIMDYLNQREIYETEKSQSTT